MGRSDYLPCTQVRSHRQNVAQCLMSVSFDLQWTNWGPCSYHYCWLESLCRLAEQNESLVAALIQWSWCCLALKWGRKALTYIEDSWATRLIRKTHQKTHLHRPPALNRRKACKQRILRTINSSPLLPLCRVKHWTQSVMWKCRCDVRWRRGGGGGEGERRYVKYNVYSSRYRIYCLHKYPAT